MAPESNCLYMTVDQVAELLQVSAPTVYRWVQSDPSFPALKVHGVVRVPRARLERWLADREQGRRPRHQISSQASVVGNPQTSEPSHG